MNTSEGIRRIAAAVRWIAYILAAFPAVLGAIGLYNRGDMIVTVGMLILAALIVVVGRLVAWVIDGFGAAGRAN